MSSRDPGMALVPRWVRVSITGIVASLALSVLSAVATTTPASGVVHGVPLLRAATTQPWAVALYYAPAGRTPQFVCSGSLISQQHVVTAAHCVRDFTAGDLSVQVGSNTLGRGRRIAVDGLWWNPRYSPRTFANDIAVLHLLQPAGVSKVVKLASSAKSGTGKLTLFGWGNDERGRVAYLRAASLVNLDSVGRRFYGRTFVPATMIAAGKWIPTIKRFASACSGDSGGPLIQYVGAIPVLVGVVSYGNLRCDLAPSVFTRVSAVRTLLTAGIAAANARAARANLAAPVLLSPPTITGAVEEGQTLTCEPGTWTSNALSFTTTWTVAGTTVPAGRTLVVTRELTGTTVGCTVQAVAHRRTALASTSRAIPPAPATVTWLDAAGPAVTLRAVARAATDIPGPVRILTWCVRIDGAPLARSLVFPAGGPIAGNDLIWASFDTSTGCYTSGGGDLRTGYLSLEVLTWAPGSHTIDLTVTDDRGRSTAAPTQAFAV